MNADDQNPPYVSDDDLLDWSIGRLDSPVDHVEHALAASAELRQRADAVHRTLSLLDKFKPAPPDDDLAERICRYVAAVRLAPPPAKKPARLSIFSLAEIGAVAAAIMLLALVFVPQAMKAHASSQRHACQANMRQIGVGLEHYANSNSRSLPVPKIPDDGNWLNRDLGRRATGTAPLFILVARSWVRPQDVTCPAAGGQVFTGDPTGLLDFPDASNCSYSFQNLFNLAVADAEASRAVAVLDKSRPRPIMADRNPLFRDDSFCKDTSCTSNSYNHGREGQNVLFTDGRVRWIDSPRIGGDNIWLAGSTREYRGTETSQEDDCFFAP